MSQVPSARRVLFVAYAFPPVGGAGVQRVTKFIKYLPSAGWAPSVLTPSNPSVPVLDESLTADVPPDTVIRRARTLEPSYAVKNAVSAGAGNARRGAGKLNALVKGAARGVFIRILQPDPQVLWYPAAVREGLRLLRELPHEVIVATGPPFSGFLIGAALSRRTGLPLVLDYRDEWSLSNRFLENKGYGSLALRFQAFLQRRVVRRARALVATTDSSAEALAEVRDRASSRAEVVCIHNGFDPDDFVDPGGPPGARDRYRILYTGTLWNLTSVAPLVEAIRRVCAESPTLAASLELRIVGRRTGDQQAMLSALAGSPVRVIEHDYVDHDEVVRMMQSADALCALLTDAPGAERVLPGKIFEYMASRRPILAIAPAGDLWRVLSGYPSAERFPPADVGGIARWVAERLEAFRPGEALPPLAWNDSRYDRREQAKALARVLSQACDAARVQA